MDERTVGSRSRHCVEVRRCRCWWLEVCLLATTTGRLCPQCAARNYEGLSRRYRSAYPLNLATTSSLSLHRRRLPVHHPDHLLLTQPSPTSSMLVYCPFVRSSVTDPAKGLSLFHRARALHFGLHVPRQRKYRIQKKRTGAHEVPKKVLTGSPQVRRLLLTI
jgi:hypothetical protein